MRAVAAVEGAQRGHHAEDRRDPLAIRREAHVVIPLIVDGEGLHAPGYRMHWQRFELRRPRRVHAPEHFEIPPGPIEHGKARVPDRDLDPVVGGTNSHALGRQLIHQLQSVWLDRGMSCAAIGKNHHGIG